MHTPTHAASPHTAPTPWPGSGFRAPDSRGSPSSFLRSSAPPRSPRPSAPPHRTPTPQPATAEPEDPTKPAPHPERVPAPGAQSESPEAQTKPEAPSQSAPKPHSQECDPLRISFSYSTSPHAFLCELGISAAVVQFKLPRILCSYRQSRFQRTNGTSLMKCYLEGRPWRAEVIATLSCASALDMMESGSPESVSFTRTGGTQSCLGVPFT